MKKTTVVALLLVAWLSALVGCGDSKEKSPSPVYAGKGTSR